MPDIPCPSCANLISALGVWEDEEKATDTSLHMFLTIEVRCMLELAVAQEEAGTVSPANAGTRG